uniref:Uncharacterized protein n=1 Tax=Arion vulgaris TaxID=1028688 RepID=A0A0B7AY32_9EUPU
MARKLVKVDEELLEFFSRSDSEEEMCSSDSETEQDDQTQPSTSTTTKMAWLSTCYLHVRHLRRHRSAVKMTCHQKGINLIQLNGLPMT